MSTSTADTKLNAITIRVAIIAALAGLLFGMDIAYVNGSLEFIVKSFTLTLSESQHVAGTLLIGAAVGAIFSGALSKKWGRKTVLIIAASIFTIFTFVGVFFTKLLKFSLSHALSLGLQLVLPHLYHRFIYLKLHRGTLEAP